jgi:hypothetical protein
MGLFDNDSGEEGYFLEQYGQLKFKNMDGQEFSVVNSDELTISHKVVYKVEYYNVGLMGLGSNINVTKYKPKTK